MLRTESSFYFQQSRKCSLFKKIITQLLSFRTKFDNHSFIILPLQKELKQATQCILAEKDVEYD